MMNIWEMIFLIFNDSLLGFGVGLGLGIVVRVILYMLLCDIIYYKLLFCNYATIVVA